MPNTKYMEENFTTETITEPELTPDSPQEEQETQDPMQKELERVRTSKYTKEEKAIFSYKNIRTQLKGMGIDPDELEKPPTNYDDDDKPVTMKMFKQMQAQNAQKSALDLANELQNDVERELVKHHIENTIRPSGDPALDLRNARAIANSARNSAILEEVGRKPIARNHSGASSAPHKRETDKIELSREDLAVQQAFGLSDDEIKKALKV